MIIICKCSPSLRCKLDLVFFKEGDTNLGAGFFAFCKLDPDLFLRHIVKITTSFLDSGEIFFIDFNLKKCAITMNGRELKRSILRQLGAFKL